MHLRGREVVEPVSAVAGPWFDVYLKVVAPALLEAAYFLYAVQLSLRLVGKEKSAGNAQNLHFTLSNSAPDRNSTNAPIVTLNTAQSNFWSRIRTGTLSGQKIALLVIKLSIVFF